MSSDTNGRSRIERLILEQRTAIYGFILAHVPDMSIAEDVFQEVCLTVCECWERYDSSKPFRAWAMGIARNKILQHIERSKGHRSVLIDPTIADAIAENTNWDADDTERKRALHDCLERLVRRARRIIDLRYAEGLSIREIAARVGIGSRSVSVSLSRIKVSLLKCVRSRLRLCDES